MLLFFISFASFYDDLKESVLFQPHNWNSRYFRIPAICTANDGSLITATDARWINKNDLPARISVMIRRSPDNGVSWSDPIIISGPIKDTGHGDASIMVDRKTGTVICLFNGDNGFFRSTAKNPVHIYMSRSHDNGITWEPMIDITHFLYSSLCTECNKDRKTWAGMFATSGYICQLRDGRIMVAGTVRCWGQVRNYAIYSDDCGDTWDMGLTYADKRANEAKFVEKNDGVVIISVRNRGYRRFVFSSDRGDHWVNETKMTDIWDSPCNGEIIRYTSTIDGYDKDRLLHTVTYVKNFPRRNVSMLLSYDEGKTWPIKKQLNNESSQLGSYSSIAIGKDGMIYVYYEKGISLSDPDEFNMTVSRFSLEWLTDGQDRYTPPGDLLWCIINKEDLTSTKLCPANYHQLNLKVFDSYVESYFIYPRTVNYIFTTTIRDFTINLSREGLETGKYVNEIKDSKPTIQFIGHSRSSRTFEMKNVHIIISSEELSFNTFIFDDVIITIINTTNLSKVEIGSTHIRLINQYSKTSFITTILNVSKATVELENEHSIEDEALLILRGISGVESHSGSTIRIISIINKSQIHIKGNWTKEEAQNITIVSTTNHHTRVLLDLKNLGKFGIEGEEPEYIDTPDDAHFEIIAKFLSRKTGQSNKTAQFDKRSKGAKGTLIFLNLISAAVCVFVFIVLISFFIHQKQHTAEHHTA
ncbi:hypothetical protein TRFO_33394 [Tritrichomonas foetus]|uniref:Sialidase domain-containing protein n=1 Tax=Tritrichomonas foetus TaxID=1144522 RepID=A0A1J4JR76_9EUKA|nr:hypothetical protein TRFO_33394 [Tritrichomonas foetus]|eukprot:OHT00014.1 hypothetical protein TRFO_33394 [Tritrichomonas foetus]